MTHELAGEDERLKSQMERVVPSYDAYMRRMTLGRESILRQMTVSLAGVKPGDWVLEVGCGTGTLTLEAKRQAGPAGRVFGIDIIPGMIEAARQKAAQANQEISFQLAGIDEIPFPDRQFDVVMCSFMIFHMSEAVRHKGIAEIYRLLKPGGRLLVLDLALPPQPFSRAIARRLLGFMLQHDLGELLPVLEQAGFSDIETAPVKFRILGLSILGFVRARAHKG